jgi:cytidylate kinase
MSLITISQGIGCDGNEIARKVSESLQIELYDDSKLKEEARRTGLHSEQLKAFDEKAPGYFERNGTTLPCTIFASTPRRSGSSNLPS